MDRRTTLLATAEFLAWWAALAVLWLVLISAVDTLELAVGAGAAAMAALAAVAARRAVTGR
jgi:multisubunit Na+/H+ antiporter MnhE subunit